MPLITPTELENEKIKAISEFLYNRMKFRKLNMTLLGKATGLSRDSTSTALNGKANFTLVTFMRILHALDLEITIKEKQK